MSYEISISHMEKESLGRVTFRGLSETITSARKSQFQCIGYFLEKIDLVRDHEQRYGVHIVNPGYALDALMKHCKLPRELSERLLEAVGWEDRFKIVWAYLPDEQKTYALGMEEKYWDNFWPGFSMVRAALGYFEPELEDSISVVPPSESAADDYNNFDVEIPF